jgi:hypothetical protein
VTKSSSAPVATPMPTRVPSAGALERLESLVELFDCPEHGRVPVGRIPSEVQNAVHNPPPHKHLAMVPIPVNSQHTRDHDRRRRVLLGCVTADFAMADTSSHVLRKCLLFIKELWHHGSESIASGRGV